MYVSVDGVELSRFRCRWLCLMADGMVGRLSEWMSVVDDDDDDDDNDIGNIAIIWL